MPTKTIEEMILAENDAKTRALLVVLNSINLSLTANTSMTLEEATKLDKHLSRFEEKEKEFHVLRRKDDEIINKGKGMWKVTAVVLSIVQIIVFSIASLLFSDLQDIHSKLQLNVVEHQHFKDKLEMQKNSGGK